MTRPEISHVFDHREHKFSIGPNQGKNESKTKQKRKKNEAKTKAKRRQNERRTEEDESKITLLITYKKLYVSQVMCYDVS